jgi:serine/threonine protein kinase/tetratricopeptide (TPR) repeat protein
MSQSADAERWRVVESLFDAALQRPPAERAGYLREACANDQDLHREVESLLAHSPADDPPRAWAAAAAVHLITHPAPLEPGQRVGPYEIISFLAAGGMGEVYRARDTRLKRDVALKTLPESVAADRDRIARFEREAELLASLNHPYIANIYGVEEDHGTRAIVMELVEGETLAERIAAHPSGLTAVEALSIARQITEALQAAHEKGIVHRDLKPANVKITVGGTVKVLDFGLATAAGDSATRENLTQSGTLVGTPRYMAPEQFVGDPIDARTDIYAAGLVLFEMLTGRPPFEGISTLARLEAILKTEPPSLPPPHARSHVDYIVRRALDRRPDARYQTAAAMVADLRAETGTTIGSAIAVRPRVRLVVLPFRLLRPDEETAFLGGALPEAITASLSSVRTVLVRANSAALRFGSSADLGQVARELDVDHVLTGTILRSGDQLRVTCQLVGAPSGELRWSETMHVPVGDLFTVQDSLSRRIVRMLPLPDSDDSTLVIQDVPATPRAYELYLRANQLSYDDPQWGLAKSLYEQCVTIDPSYAPAWARLGRINRVIGKFDERAPRPSYQVAEANFRRALELNPDLSIGHTLFAYLEAESGDSEAALLRLLPCLQRQPNDPDLFGALCHVSRYCGLLDVSVAAHKRARMLDPKVLTSVVHTFMMLGDYASVLKEARNDPGSSIFFAIAHRELGGSLEEALAVLNTERSRLGSLRLPFRAAFEGVMRGDRSMTRAAGLELIADEFPDGEGFYYMARALARVGELELATEAFARATRSFFCVPGMDRDRWIDPLRGRADFEAALATARDRHLRTVAQFESAGGRYLIDT